MNTPFGNGKNIKSPLRAILDRCIIWPIPGPSKVGAIELPDQLKEDFRKAEGILLSVGPGYYSNDGKFHGTSDQLKPGVRVLYDKTVPWGTKVTGNDNKEHGVVICGVQDIQGVLND
jgi:hypothetical protein